MIVVSCNTDFPRLCFVIGLFYTGSSLFKRRVRIRLWQGIFRAYSKLCWSTIQLQFANVATLGKLLAGFSRLSTCFKMCWSLLASCLMCPSALPLGSVFNIYRLELNGTLQSFRQALLELLNALSKFAVHIALIQTEACVKQAFQFSRLP